MRPPKILPTVTAASGPRFIRHQGSVASVRLRDENDQLLDPDAWLGTLRGATILLTKDVFATAVIETTMARLEGFGIRAVLAPGFEARVFDRCVAIGVLPLPLDPLTLDTLASRVDSLGEAGLTIDLENEFIEISEKEKLAFTSAPRTRQKLLTGATDLDEVLTHRDKAAVLRRLDRAKRPWLYEDP